MKKHQKETESPLTLPGKSSARTETLQTHRVHDILNRSPPKRYFTTILQAYYELSESVHTIICIIPMLFHNPWPGRTDVSQVDASHLSGPHLLCRGNGEERTHLCTVC